MDYNEELSDCDPVAEEHRQKRLARSIAEIRAEWEELSLSNALDHVVANSVSVRQNDLRDMLDYLAALEARQ